MRTAAAQSEETSCLRTVQQTDLAGMRTHLCQRQGRRSVSSYKAHIHCDAIIEDYVNDSMYDGYFDTEEMVEQYIRKACSGCPERGEYDDECEVDPLFCEKAAQRALHPTVLAAAIESIRPNSQEENT